MHGKLVDNGQIVVADNSVSHALAYDAAGQAVIRTFYQGHALNYERTLHDERGQRIAVYDVPADGADVATAGSWQSEGFAYDDVGRLLKHRSFDAQGLKHIDAYAYDADGRQLSQSSHGRTVNNAGLPMLEGEGLRQISNVRFHGYDAAGRSLGYTYSVQANEIGVGDANSPVNFSQTFTTVYEARDSYLEKQVLGTSTNSNFKASQSTSAYDAWGRRIGVTETTPGQSGVTARSRYFAYDMEGNILQRSEDGKTQTYAYAAGQNVASGKNTATGDLDVLNQLTAYQSSDLGDGRVQVQAGDTLRGIAQRVYGNSNLWYVLAEANAIASDAELVAGTTLKVPDVKVTANDATTFKPFNPNEAVGNTAPSLPYITPPPKKQCNVVKMIVIIVVAIVVAYFTAGAATGMMTSAANTAAASAAATGAATGTVVSTGLATATVGVAGSATLSVGGAMLAGAAGGAAASLASQAVGSSMGVTKFSWKNVAAGAITGAITGGIASQYGTVGQALAGSSPNYLKAAGLAFANVAAGYAGQAAVGNPTNFSWKAVASSVIGSLVSAKVAPYASTRLQNDFAGEIVGGLSGGMVSGSLRKALDGTEPDYVQIATDAFGNALGNAIVGGINRAQIRHAKAGRLDRIIDQFEGRSAAEKDVLRSVNQNFSSDVSDDIVLSYTEQSIRSATDPSFTREQRIALALSALPYVADENGSRLDPSYYQEVVDAAQEIALPLASVSVGPLQQMNPATGQPYPVTPQEVAYQEQLLQEDLRKTDSPALLLRKADEAGISVGNGVDWLAEQMEKRPYLGFALGIVDFAQGPAMFAVRQGINATPIGGLLTSMQERAVGVVSNRFQDQPGYDSEQAAQGAKGTFAIGGMSFLGFSGVLKRLPGISHLLAKMPRRELPEGTRIAGEDWSVVPNGLGGAAELARKSKFLHGGESFRSFDALKRSLGSAGENRGWHHIVEQSQVGQFGTGAIQNTKNVVNIPNDIHHRISGYYSSKQQFTNGLTVRQWLRQQSFDEQYHFGMDVLKRFGGK